ncbi:HlyC/CorC family transporter [Marinagarivorans cellulosilyticus]|uniref:Magnesium and cobalt efflux protein CorC n=1 Tax=Marinagarivorans cellulosilyticus TaxID=2721545 RepID=A0AAN1WK24_9GAMM|nr:transporter associated domain-containing protein [Marinagarivorans cellulosilyticus]BCD99040.1 magnesium and cobalt transporter [Marinagarivorans cellulosilyticus]
MSEEPPSSQPAIKERTQERSWIDKLIHSFSNNEPQSREELLTIIKDAASNKLLDDEALEIIEGALSVSNLQVREIMIPRSQMVVIKHDETPEEFLPKIIESCHSRFPVIGESIDDIRGILLAKDLLSLLLNRDQPFALEDMLRPANIIPESKRLNVLLKEFREKRYHMAIIIDEYGGISGLVTIEDILEEIVGEIEDETDDDDDDFIRRVSDEDYIVKALTPIDDFNDHFDCDFDDADFDTIGGIVTQAFGHMPARNEVVELKGFRFRILYADNRQIHLIRLTRL